MESKSTDNVSETLEIQDDLSPTGRGCWARYFPYGFWYELKCLSMLALPIMGSSMINYFMTPVSLFFVGSLGKTELAAAGLAISIYHVAGVSIITGLLTASETLFSQTFGGTNKFRLGIQVQRAAIILAVFCVPCWAIYVVAEPIVLATNQPPLVAKYTGEYLLGLMPTILFVVVFEISSRYVQTQNKPIPPFVAGICGNIVNATAHYLFFNYTDMKFIGSAISQSMGFMAQATIVVGYIWLSGMYRKTWDGIHVELWHDWGIFFRLAIPGMMMSGLEWWVCESGSLLAGFRGEQALAVQTILNNIESLIYSMFPLGFGIATTIRIGQFLGANKSVGPRSTACVALITTIFVTIVNAIVLYFARYHISKIFSSDEGIIQMTANCLTSIMVFQFVDSIVGICSGIIRGVGMQRAGAVVCCVCMYVLGGPLGCCLMLFTDLSVAGFWWGLTVGMGLESLIYVTLILRIDWKKMCSNAAKRTEIKFVYDVETAKDDENKEEVGSLKSLSINNEDNERVKACTPLIVFTRSVLISVAVLMLIAALCCQFVFDWKSYFPTYCLLKNGTLVTIPSAGTENFTVSVAAECLRVLP